MTLIHSLFRLSCTHLPRMTLNRFHDGLDGGLYYSTVVRKKRTDVLESSPCFFLHIASKSRISVATNLQEPLDARSFRRLPPFYREMYYQICVCDSKLDKIQSRYNCSTTAHLFFVTFKSGFVIRNNSFRYFCDDIIF